ncbi:MAG: hypothetical protein A7315_04610 [Candidatus Altiarchaeales archaeon WOR_SM1_79]|nr:MAG: hypothetical protein A7315_04610 [Candidatus Altiarchaeales archaeon WOR_SM1_79]
MRNGLDISLQTLPGINVSLNCSILNYAGVKIPRHRLEDLYLIFRFLPLQTLKDVSGVGRIELFIDVGGDEKQDFASIDIIIPRLKRYGHFDCDTAHGLRKYKWRKWDVVEGYVSNPLEALFLMIPEIYLGLLRCNVKFSHDSVTDGMTIPFWNHALFSAFRKNKVKLLLIGHNLLFDMNRIRDRIMEKFNYLSIPGFIWWRGSYSFVYTFQMKKDASGISFRYKEYRTSRDTKLFRYHVELSGHGGPNVIEAVDLVDLATALGVKHTSFRYLSKKFKCGETGVFAIAGIFAQLVQICDFIYDVFEELYSPVTSTKILKNLVLKWRSHNNSLCFISQLCSKATLGRLLRDGLLLEKPSAVAHIAKQLLSFDNEHPFEILFAGGRNEVLRNGIIDGDICYFDFVSQYPSIMHDLGLEHIIWDIISNKVQFTKLRNISDEVKECVDESLSLINSFNDRRLCELPLLTLLRKYPIGWVVVSSHFPITAIKHTGSGTYSVPSIILNQKSQIVYPPSNKRNYVSQVELSITKRTLLSWGEYLGNIFHLRSEAMSWEEIENGVEILSDKIVMHRETDRDSALGCILDHRKSLKFGGAKDAETEAKIGALKMLMNCFIGLFAEVEGDLHCYGISNAVTSTGRLYTYLAEYFAMKSGADPLYTDTDCLILKNNNPDFERLILLFENHSPFREKLHNRARKFICIGKKRYALMKGDKILKSTKHGIGIYSSRGYEFMDDLYRAIAKENTLSIGRVIKRLKSFLPFFIRVTFTPQKIESFPSKLVDILSQKGEMDEYNNRIISKDGFFVYTDFLGKVTPGKHGYYFKVPIGNNHFVLFTLNNKKKLLMQFFHSSAIDADIKQVIKFYLKHNINTERKVLELLGDTNRFLHRSVYGNVTKPWSAEEFYDGSPELIHYGRYLTIKPDEKDSFDDDDFLSTLFARWD